MSELSTKEFIKAAQPDTSIETLVAAVERKANPGLHA